MQVYTAQQARSTRFVGTVVLTPARLSLLEPTARISVWRVAAAKQASHWMKVATASLSHPVLASEEIPSSQPDP